MQIFEVHNFGLGAAIVITSPGQQKNLAMPPLQDMAPKKKTLR
jgi:hypothetical protein